MSVRTLPAPEPRAARDVPELAFPLGLPGFPGPRRFALLRWGSDGPWSVLVDLDDADVRFLVVPPGVFFPDYQAVLDDALVAAIGLEDPSDCLLLVIVSFPAGGGPGTANLLGPVAISTRTLRGVQAVLSDTRLSTRTPLPA